jgi:ParB-like chromosome segregation protein Spo0J
VEGHGRLLAAKNLGLESVPCIRLAHLTEAQRREYALTHNKSAELSGWDFGTLESEMDALSAEFDMADFGFTENSVDTDSLDDLFSPAPEKEPEEPKQIQCPHCGEWFTP